MLKLNGVLVEPTIFPDNTSQVWHLDDKLIHNLKLTGAEIEWDFNHEGEIMHLAQLVCLLNSYGITLNKMFIPYFPYARQDKPISNISSFALDTFLYILNDITQKIYHSDKFVIETIDPHFTISEHYMRDVVKSVSNATDIYNKIYTTPAFGFQQSDKYVKCYPDKGAASRYGADSEDIVLDKVRDQETGLITSMTGMNDKYAKDKTVVLIDDICDGGMTFILAAKHLYSLGAKQVDLVVSHGIFSKGLQPLKDAGIKNIYTRKGKVVGEKDGGILYETVV